MNTLDSRIVQLVSFVKWGRTLSPNLGGVFAGLLQEYRDELRAWLAVRSRERRLDREDRAYEAERERLLEMQEEHPEMFDPDTGEMMPDLNREGDPAFNGAFSTW